MKILIDNGHGVETPGKRSPDGRLREYAYAREIARRVVDRLLGEGIDAECLVEEDTDVPLRERVFRANERYIATGRQACLVSIHCNAAGNGNQWRRARGWSVFVDPTASTKSKQLATEMAKAAKVSGVKVRQSTRDKLYWTSGLYICKHTKCPAVLVENFFQDNREDVDFLLSEAGKECVTEIMVEGIKNYLKLYG